LVDKLAAMEEEFGFRSAWNFVPHKYKVDFGLIEDLKDRGHEIGVHGYNHDGRLFESHRTFSRRLGPINQAIADFGSLGFRAPMVHRNLQWMEDLEIDYDSSCFDIDPFQAMPGGVGGPWPFISGKFVELPYTLPQDHTLLISLGEGTPRIWIEKLARLRSLAGMALLITHPDYLDTPSRLGIYRQFLEHLCDQQKVWHALPREVADWWRQRDELNTVGIGLSSEVIGPEAARARVFSLSDLQPS
jgi:peptidoglycan/xylan/chitin deacetylase (PgdA/CDA1 family)